MIAEVREVYAQEIMRLKRENAAQLDELHRISEALGSNDGHSSVTHIEILKGEIAALREHIARRGKSTTPAVFIVEQNKILHEQNAALREQLVQALAIARKYEPDEKTSYVKYASDEIAELLKEEGK